MKFKADCSFLLYGSSMSWFVSGFRLNNFVAFILTGYLLSTRMIRNRMCPELRILINFLD